MRRYRLVVVGTRQLMRARLIAVALVGLVLAAGISVAASAVSTPHVGLSSEPPSAGHGLVVAPGQPAVTLPAPRGRSTAPAQHEPAHSAKHARDERDEAAQGEALDADD